MRNGELPFAPHLTPNGHLAASVSPSHTHTTALAHFNLNSTTANTHTSLAGSSLSVSTTTSSSTTSSPAPSAGTSLSSALPASAKWAAASGSDSKLGLSGGRGSSLIVNGSGVRMRSGGVSEDSLDILIDGSEGSAQHYPTHHLSTLHHHPHTHTHSHYSPSSSSASLAAASSASSSSSLSSSSVSSASSDPAQKRRYSSSYPHNVFKKVTHRRELIKKCGWVSLAVFFALVLFMELRYGSYLRYQMLHVRGKHALNTLLGDDSHRQDEKEMLSEMEFRLSKYESQFHDQICLDYQKRKTESGNGHMRFGWITSVKNELYVLPTIAFGHSLRKYSCERKMVVIVGEGVGEASREALRKVGFEVRMHPSFDCRSQSKGYGFGYFADIPGSHMKMYCWNYTEYDRLIYADGDLITLSSIDELFTYADLQEEEIAAAYCAAPGTVDPCFNTGLIVLRPSAQTFESLLQTWKDLQDSVGCVNDQSYFWHYFTQKGRRFHFFPYAYNVRRQSYHPMKVYHSAGHTPKKPWLVPMSREEAKNIPILDFPEDMYKVWWFYLYEALDVYQINDWYDDWKQVSHERA